MEGLCYVFPDAVCFVDGKKFQAWIPKEKGTQMNRYDEQQKIHAFIILVWVDVFGVIIEVDIFSGESLPDRTLYKNCAQCREPARFFDESHKAIAIVGFQGKGKNLIFPFKTNQATRRVTKQKFNKPISSQRVRNKLSIILIKNRFRLFLEQFYLLCDAPSHCIPGEL